MARLATILLHIAGIALIGCGFFIAALAVGVFATVQRYFGHPIFQEQVDRYLDAAQYPKDGLVVGLGLAAIGGILIYLGSLFDQLRRHLAERRYSRSRSGSQ